METGSPNEPAVTLNSPNLRGRTIEQHLEKESPLLVSDDQEIVMAKWVGRPHRKATKIGKEPDVIHIPEQNGPIPRSTHDVEIVRCGKYARETPSTPSVTKYRRVRQDEDLLGPNEREKCDVPIDPPPSPLRMKDGTISTNSIAGEVGNNWGVAISRRARTVSEWALAVGLYSIAAGEVALTSTLWSRRDLLPATVFVTVLFVRWTWIWGKPIYFGGIRESGTPPCEIGADFSAT